MNYPNDQGNPAGAIPVYTARSGNTLDPTNSSTVNILSGGTFTGTWALTDGFGVLEVAFKADQNFNVYIEQSADGTNVLISDLFEYLYAAQPEGLGVPVRLMATYYRVRIVNIGAAATTSLVLQTTALPLADTLPRTLSPDGLLQSAVNHVEDDSGFTLYYTPYGENVSVPLYRLTGEVFDQNTLDTNFWTITAVGSGTATVTNGNLALSTGTTANSSVILQSNLIARFTAGAPNKFRSFEQFPDTGTANNIRNWGMMDTAKQNGAYFQLNGTTFNLVTRKAGVETPIANGTFNGMEGNTFTLDTNGHLYEIIITPGIVFFYIDDELIHKAAFPLSTWTATVNLGVYYENTNSGGSTTNITLNSRGGFILKMGIPQTQPTGTFVQGLTAGQTLKQKAGNIHSVIISGVTNNAVVTLYDSTTATGKVIWTSGPMTNQTVPFALDFKGIPFSIGLTIAITTAACNALVAYE